MSNEASSVFKEAIRNNLGPLLPFLEDKSVSEILVNGPFEVFVEKKGKLEKVAAQFASEDDLRAAVNSIAQSVGRRIDDETPRLDARLPDGSRIAAVIPPCSRKGTTLSIRKFTNNKISLSDYIKLGALTEEAARFLDISMFLGKNILVSGGTGSGKTTLLSLLCTRIPKGQRVLVIEDSSELQIDYEHVVMFETRQADGAGKGEVNMRDLLKSALRLRPDRIIVGEVRSSEALELLNAMNTGHKGCMGTVHANTPEDAIVRLEALAQGSDTKVSERALRMQVASAIDMIVQVSRFADGSRRVAAISEVTGFTADGSYNVTPIFSLPRMLRKPDGTLEGRLQKSLTPPSFIQEIVDNKLPSLW
ncbi:MAG: CpaF family protein [Pseudobdellovibrionaceae bacterium]